ncbi:hypothetical protein BCR34DRAFT_145741 [Clohesyomyces aquaticus]|uniref:Uncharacterized protein n=1 Tax=Clohesyomyces aquaticus TaxID=1231657 RepID=A0A1Y2A0K3_9PLEO|nr:hypothetical protein BCR34DRAFT_145741 [Clohesyomyces aquaticus]
MSESLPRVSLPLPAYPASRRSTRSAGKSSCAVSLTHGCRYTLFVHARLDTLVGDARRHSLEGGTSHRAADGQQQRGSVEGRYEWVPDRVHCSFPYQSGGVAPREMRSVTYSP